MSSITTKPGFLRLLAVQGNSEAQTKLYGAVLRRSTGAVDEVMRQELWRSLLLRGKAGQSAGGVW